MKLSNISVIFIIIVLPIILLLSYYISLQIDTINMQTAYTTKQLQATREAIEAFEINTVEWNEAYSTLSDSKRRDIMASINTFSTGFANSLGIGGVNKENILGYVPAIAFTLYDGYYIYSPAEVKEVIKDKNGVAVFLTENLVKAKSSQISDYTYNEEHEGKLLYEYDSSSSIVGGYPDGTYNGTKFTVNSDYAKSTYKHILKPFSTYSARYKNEDTDIIVNYTLDNYISIYGTIKNKQTGQKEYVEKAGYLILAQDDLTLEPEQLSEKIAWRDNEDNKYTCKTYPYVYAEDNTKVYFDNDKTFQVSSTGIRTYLNETTSVLYKKVITENVTNNKQVVVYQALNGDNKGDIYSEKSGITIKENIIINRDYSARNYYIESTDFTNWVKENLSDIKIEHMQVPESEKSKYGNKDDKIFDFDNHEVKDPESDDSIIVNHKREVIKQTLISNLNQAITSYSRNSEGEYSLPMLVETDWDHVLRNVSIITFVQNIPIGMKYYNNYAVATSTANKEFTNPDEIYLTADGDEYYHKPYCSKLEATNGIIGYRNIDYLIKSYKEGENTKYYYKHSISESQEYQACYYCLVQRDLYNKVDSQSHKKVYKTAIARERYRNISEMNLKSKVELELEHIETPITSYTVTFDAKGGTVSPNEIMVTNGNAYGELPNPIREGYTFDGWYTEANGGTKIKTTTIVERNENHTLYAHWVKQPELTYTVTFDAKGGSGAPEQQIKKHGEDLTLSTDIPTIEGYTFVGWSTGSDATSAIYSAGGVYKENESVILYAVWEQDTSITLNEKEDQWIPNNGSTLNLIATVYPSNATVTWLSEEPSIATVSGGTVTAKGTGKTTITARAGEKSVSVDVYVYNLECIFPVEKAILKNGIKYINIKKEDKAILKLERDNLYKILYSTNVDLIDGKIKITDSDFHFNIY